MLRLLTLAALLPALPLAADATPAAQWYVAGSRLYAQGQYDQALRDFAYSLRLDNRQAAAYQAVGSCYYAERQMAYALRYYQYSLLLNPNNPALSALVARLRAAQDPLDQANQLYHAGRYSEALASYQAVAAGDPQNAKAFQGAGNCQYALGDRTAASAAYHKALALSPDNKVLADFVARLDAAQEASTKGGIGDWPQPLWRSAILPGWGQFYNGQETKGWILGGVTVGLAVATVASDLVGVQAENQYMGLGAGLPQASYDKPYDTWAEMANINHACYIAFGAMYIYTLIDAVVNSKPVRLADMDSPMGPSSNVQMALINRGVEMRWKVAEF